MKCIICESDFQPKQKTQKCCSPDCSKENRNRIAKAFMTKNPEYYRAAAKARYAANPEAQRQRSRDYRKRVKSE